MKKLLTFALSAAIALSGAGITLLMPEPAHATSQNLIINGDFESADENDFPTGWDSDGKNLIPDGSFETGTASWTIANASVADVTFDTTKKRTGNSSLKIEYKPTQTSQTWVAARLRLTNPSNDNKKFIVNAGEAYRLRGYFNVSGYTTGSYAMLSFQIDDSTGAKIVSEGSVSGARYQQETAPGTDWDKKEFDYTIPASVGQGGKLYLIAARTNGMAGMVSNIEDIALEKLGRVDKTTGYNSSNSLKIVGYSGGYLDSSTPPNEDSWYTANAVPVTAGDRLNYSYMLKTSGSGNAFIRFTFKDASNNRIGIIEGDKQSNISDWTNITGSVTVPEGAVKVVTSLVVTPGLTGWFDNVQLIKAVQIKSVEVNGEDSIVIPQSGNVEKVYTALVRDKDNNILDSESVNWSIQGATNNVSIDANGKLTVGSGAVKRGVVQVIATSVTDPTKSGYINVTLVGNEPVPNIITIASGSDKLYVPSQQAYTVTVIDQYGAQLMGAQLLWEKVSGPPQVTVSPDGVVNVPEDSDVGALVLRVTATANEVSKQQDFNITVAKRMSGLAVQPRRMTIFKGTQANISAVITPPGAEADNISFISSQPDIASVEQLSDPLTAVVRGVSAGVATIRVSAQGGYTADCTVTVEDTPDIDLGFETSKGWNYNIKNIVQNGGFEEDAVWSAANNSVASITRVNNKALTGSWSGRIVYNSNILSSTWASFRDGTAYPVSVNSTYRFVLNAITQGLSGSDNAQLSFALRDSPSGTTVVAENSGVCKITTNSADADTWQKVTADYKIPQNGNYIIYLAARLNAKSGASAWFDDLAMNTIQELDGGVKRSGEYSMKVGGYMSPDSDVVYSSDIPVQGKTTYTASVYSKTDGAGCKAGIRINYKDSSGKVIKSQTSPTVASSEWRVNTITLTAPEDASCMSIGVVADGAGFAWFDDLSYKREVSVGSSVVISGGDKIAVPQSGSKTKIYTATVLDQFGTPMSGEDIIWSLDNTPAGVSMSNGAITVLPSALMPGNNIIRLRATLASNASVSTEMDIALVDVTGMVITGPDKILLPDKTETAVYNASTVGNDGGPASNVLWSIEGNVQGVSIADGVLTVASSAKVGDIAIKAVWSSDDSVFAQKTVNIYKNKTSVSGGGSGDFGGPTSGGGVAYIPGTPKTPLNVLPPSPNFTVVEFTDIDKSNWAAEAITEFAKLGIVAGKGNNEFLPTAYITRAEFLKILIGALKLKDTGASCNFADVSAREWYYPYVATAYKLGITKGYPDGSFGVNKSITRQEIAALTMRAAQAANISLPVLTKAPVVFSDIWDIDSYAVEAVSALAKAKIINGKADGSFSPADNATRAEAVKIVYGIYRVLNPALSVVTQTPVNAAQTPTPSQSTQASAEGTTDSGNLISNGDISHVTGTTPDSWMPQGTDKSECLVDTSEFKSSGASLKLIQNVTGWRGWRHSDIPVKPGKSYKFSVYVKTANLGDSAVYVSFGVKNASGEWIVKDNDSSTTNVLRDNKLGTHDWMLLEGTYKIPDGGKAISYFTARINNKDTNPGAAVWFDDFKIEEIR